MEGLSRLFIRYHRDVVFPDDASLATLDAGASVLKWGSVLEKAFRVCVWDDKRVVKEKVDMVSRMVVILLVGVTSLGEKFKKTDVTQFRQKIRYLQISILSLLLSIATECMTLVLQHMSDQAERGEYLFASTEEGELDPVFMYLRPVGTFCAWLSCGLDSFTTFQNYTAKGTILEGLNLYLWSFARALANFVNFLSAFADMDGSSECLPEDLDLLGVGIFQGFVKRLTEMSVVREVKGVGVGVEVERVSARVSRIANVAKMMSENKEVTAFFVFDEKMDARFVVLDAESKRVERDKVSKALAVEFLKNQIGSLETSLQKMKGVTVPILIPDAGCYIHNLRFIKTLLMSRSAILIIPQDVMHGLDKMKKGNDLINVRAREAIRYLEQRFKYRSPYLRAQQDEEEGDVDVGRAFRDFLRCCVYYRDRVAPRPVDEEDVTMAVVTEDMGLREVAEGAGIVVRSLRELGRRGRRR
ncbi:hypothetical protein BC829DRAFT_250720 [Chytridium lagenaria]|nr:hypothetical protein BC829DRAFT_250720 [Chytridium lagenaria]